MSLREEIISIANGLMISADVHRTDTLKRFHKESMMHTIEAVQMLIDRLEVTANELNKALEKDYANS